MIRKLLFSLLFLVGVAAAGTIALDGINYTYGARTTTEVIVPKAEVVIPDPLPPTFLAVTSDSDSISFTVAGNPADEVPVNVVAVILVEGGDASQSDAELLAIASERQQLYAPGTVVNLSVTPSTESSRIFTLVGIGLRQDVQ